MRPATHIHALWSADGLVGELLLSQRKWRTRSEIFRGTFIVRGACITWYLKGRWSRGRENRKGPVSEVLFINAQRARGPLLSGWLVACAEWWSNLRQVHRGHPPCESNEIPTWSRPPIVPRALNTRDLLFIFMKTRLERIHSRPAFRMRGKEREAFLKLISSGLIFSWYPRFWMKIRPSWSRHLRENLKEKEEKRVLESRKDKL